MGRCVAPVSTGVAVVSLWQLFDSRPLGGVAAGALSAGACCSGTGVGSVPVCTGGLAVRVGSWPGPRVASVVAPRMCCLPWTEESGDLSPWRRRPVGLDGACSLPRCGLDCLQCLLWSAGGVWGVRSQSALWVLALRVSHWTRLETRTKECSTCASLWPDWPQGAVRAKVGALAHRGESLAVRRGPSSTGPTHTVLGFE